MHAAYALSQHWAQPTAQPAMHPRARSAFPAPGRSTEGTACPGHVVCPGGALGGRPVAVVAVGCAAASFFFGAVYVAHAMPETCGGCGELMSCTQPELRVVKGRAVSALLAVASWFLLAVLAGLAVPWVSPDLAGGMIGVAVLATACVALVGGGRASALSPCLSQVHQEAHLLPVPDGRRPQEGAH